MRMRRMKNLDVRMERCAALRIAEPALLKGNWRSLKPDATALWVDFYRKAAYDKHRSTARPSGKTMYV